MSQEFLGIGWKFPVQLNGEGAIVLSRYEEDIREAIWVILSTSRGERLMRPDFGCGIHDFVFATIDTGTLTLIEASVREALTLWEPRIELMDVKISTERIDAGKLMINIAYKVRTTNNQFNLVYPFYLTEGTP